MWPWRSRSEEDFAEEIRSNLALEADRLIGEGMNEKEAREAALRRFGNITRAQERFYESRRVLWFDGPERDGRYALRQLRTNPGFTAVAAVTLALGIGANTAILSVAHAILFQPLPYPESSRLLAIVPRPQDRSAQAENISYPTFLDWQGESRSFESLGAYVVAGSTLTGRGDATLPVTAAVTPNLFSLLGTAPLLGRTLVTADGDMGRSGVVVISESLWRDKFGQDAQIIGAASLMCSGSDWIDSHCSACSSGSPTSKA